MLFIWDLVQRAWASSVASMGTTTLAIGGGLLYPFIDLLSELQSQGWTWVVVSQHWKKRLKNSVWIAMAWWTLLFSFHLFYKVPQQIRMRAERMPAPPTSLVAILPPYWNKNTSKNPSPSLHEYGHIHVESVNLLPLTDSLIRANVRYENDGAEDTEFRLRYGIALRPVPNNPIERKKIEDELFDSLIKEVEDSQTPVSSLPVNRKQVDTAVPQFTPDLN